MKKVLCFIIVIAIVCSMCFFIINAADNKTNTSVKDINVAEKYYKNAEDTLKEQKIILGDPNGNVRPNDKITRAEMVTICSRLLDLEDNWLDEYKTTKTYPDTKNHWASKYISLANEYTFAQGYPDGTFRPENSVTYMESLRMILVAGGYGYDENDKPLEWTSGYKKVGKQLNMTGNVTCGDDEAITRGAIILMIYEMLCAEIEPPSVSIKSGTYTESQTVKLSSTDKNAKIYYTIDGSDPIEKGTLYSKTITIDKTSTLKAVIIKGKLHSKVVEFKYTIFEDKPTDNSMKIVKGKYEFNENDVTWLNNTETYGYVNNIIIINFAIGLSDEEKFKICENIDGFIGIAGSIERQNQWHIKIEPIYNKDEFDLLCSNISNIEGVWLAYIDILFEGDDTIPNDPWRDVIQGIMGVDWDEKKPNGFNWWAEAIFLPSAWEYNNHSKEKIKIGIIDNGFDIGHEDLNIKILNEEVNNPENHGTHVSGIIGATANNNIGITGIVWNKELYGIDVYQTKKQEKNLVLVSNNLDAFCELIENKVKVINFSMGYKSNVSDIDISTSIEAAFLTMINCIFYYNSDFIIVQSAGNSSINTMKHGFFSPMNTTNIQNLFNKYKTDLININLGYLKVEDILDKIINVGAVDIKKNKNEYQLSDFSNYGVNVSICAPGVSIFSTIAMGGLDGSYGNKDGTSMSAPIITGVTALVWSMNPYLKSGDIKNIVINTANIPVKSRLSADNGNYYMVNAYEAVKAVLNIQENEENKEEDNLPNDGIKYEIITETTAKVVGVTEKRDNYSIPDIVNLNGKDYRVTEIAYGAFGEGVYGTKITRLPAYYVLHHV